MNQKFARSANAPSKQLTTKAQVGMRINHFGNNVCFMCVVRRTFGLSPEHLSALLVYEIRMNQSPPPFNSSAFKGIWVESRQFQFSLRINCASLSETVQNV